ncbi:MAG: helix-turn-helix domain-containing protein [Nitriliruptorales bacterium]|nr:helix-turn-helix domain-containing protein [Nitriliruptorales bacterium]
MRSYDQYCALARALDRIGHRWTLLVIRELLLGPRRFTDLQEGLPGIATNLLSERLRQLQADGIVTRRELPAPAASTVYELTDAGHELRPTIESLIRWGGRWMQSGPGDDQFRVEWLALALDALGLTDRMSPDMTVELIVDGQRLPLGISNGRLAVRTEPDPEPQLRVTADSPTLLGIASGAIPRSDAVDEVDLDPDDLQTAQKFTELFCPPLQPLPRGAVPQHEDERFRPENGPS